ncbi:MAG: 2OG-Fe(II) oxygenase, partial [Acidimicrobiales bacterium]
MAGDPREELAAVLGEQRSGGSFATQRTAAVDDLAIEVTGVGPLRYPVIATQAKALRLVARPAKYGHGERTVLDRRVRDTWEVPRSRVKIDKRRWKRTLAPLLETIGEDLGLPATSTLTAELHSMLVYEPGQFFAPHQDSEKNDEMIGSLIVLLPSNCTGGDLVISHRNQSVRYGGTSSSLTLVAFYADTRHEVLPVERGYRVVLTYNLLLAGDTTATASLGDGVALAVTTAALLEQHFTHTPEARWINDRRALEPPDRLVFLLDHQYTQRGLRWSQLKGDDATRADVLQVAADHAGCDVALAHAEVHETYDCEEPAPPWRGRRQTDWVEELDDDELDDNDDHGDNVSLGELIDSSVAITSADQSPISFSGEVTNAELVTVTPSVELAPHTTEYTGFMGNWGNTMDRWYLRAAIVIWPRARAFAVQAKGDPLAALHHLLGPTTQSNGGTPPPPDEVSTLLRFWPDAVRHGDQQTMLPPALRLAGQLNDAELATRLVEHFTIEAVTPPDAAVMLELAEQHGLEWLDKRITTWMSPRPAYASTAGPRNPWVETLPGLCANFRNDEHAPEDLRAGSARLMVNHVGHWLTTALAH